MSFNSHLKRTGHFQRDFIQYFVLAGQSNIEYPNDLIRVTKVEVHPEWDPIHNLNDIAVLLLKSPIPQNQWTRTVGLMTTSEHDDYFGKVISNLTSCQ